MPGGGRPARRGRHDGRASCVRWDPAIHGSEPQSSDFAETRETPREEVSASVPRGRVVNPDSAQVRRSSIVVRDKGLVSLGCREPCTLSFVELDAR